MTQSGQFGLQLATGGLIITATSVPPVAVGAAVVIAALGVATALVVAANKSGSSKRTRKSS